MQEVIREITHALREQSGAAAGIARQVERVSAMPETSRGTVAGTAGASRNLHAAAQTLRRAGGRFRPERARAVPRAVTGRGRGCRLEATAA